VGRRRGKMEGRSVWERGWKIFFTLYKMKRFGGLMWIIVFLPKYSFAFILLQYIKLNII